MQPDRVHVFESAGLGKAPFRFDGMTENVYSACPGHFQAGGTCDYCSTGIRYEFWIVSADGKRFKVGSECVRKTDDSGLKRVVNAEVNRMKREARHAKDKAHIEAGLAKLPQVRGTLASQPHPNRSMALEGKTLLDWVNWMLRNAGTSGKLRVVAVINEVQKVAEVV